MHPGQVFLLAETLAVSSSDFCRIVSPTAMLSKSVSNSRPCSVELGVLVL